MSQSNIQSLVAILNGTTIDYKNFKTKLEEETKRYKLLEKLEDRQLKESLNATKVIRIKKQ